MKFRLFIIALCLILLAGCTILLDAEVRSGSNAAVVSDEALFELLFDIRNKITLQLDMDTAELEKMQADYDAYSAMGSKSPIYRMADLYVTIDTPEGRHYSYYIEEVGVRMKGNTSRQSFYNSEEGIYNIIHLKLSFQETFDDASYYGEDARVWDTADYSVRKDRTFATLEKLELRWNRCDDGTYLKEYFAYETFRQNGVPAPHTNLASFNWAGLHMGVFTINEPVDKVFLKKNLPKNALGGDLYKCGWAGSENASFLNTKSIGIEDEDKSLFYAYDLKTNKKSSVHNALTSFIREINREDITKSDFARLVDMDNFLAFAAVSYLLGNPDDMRNNCNNYYVYFRSDNGKAVFIPYDYDRCLGITAHWNPTQTGVTDDDPFSTERLAPDRGDTSANRAQYNPVIRYSVAAGGFYVREYAQILSEITEGSWFRYDTFAALYDIAKENYGDLTTPEKAFYNTDGMYLSFDIDRTSAFSSNGNISIREYLDAKLETLNTYLSETEKYADMEPAALPAAWYIRGSFTNWQNLDAYCMTDEDGLMCFEITVYWRAELKVYNTLTDKWYGSECVRESDVEFTTDGYTNIVLEKGTYRVIMDPFTEQITLESVQLQQ